MARIVLFIICALLMFVGATITHQDRANQMACWFSNSWCQAPELPFNLYMTGVGLILIGFFGGILVILLSIRNSRER